MGRRTYTDADRAAVFASLTVSDGNVKRAARETGVPEQTVRDWKRSWEAEGPPEAVAEAAATFAGEFVEQAERVRDLALHQLEARIRAGDIKSNELITAVGVLTDKVRVAQGLATNRTETIQRQDPAELAEATMALVAGALAAASQRQGEIIESTAVEQAELALPAGDS